jgi:hypothetical protein
MSVDSIYVQKSNQHIKLDTTLCANITAENQVGGYNSPTSLQNGMQKENRIQNNSSELIKTILEKEQKYFELRQPFTVNITSNGVQVWLRDSSIDGKRYQGVLYNLRNGLRDIGVRLLSLSINGELVWENNDSLDIKNESNRDNGINNVY